MSKNTDILGALNWRYATKHFDSEKKLSDAQVGRLIEAVRLSPSSFGLQPWTFLTVTDAGTRATLREVSWNQPQVTDCSHLIVLCRKADMTDADIGAFLDESAKTQKIERASLEGYENMIKGFLGGMESAEAKAHWMSLQVYLALGVLLTTCGVEGVDACPLEGFDPARYDEILGLPSRGLRSVVLCAVGHRSDGDKYALQPKVRYSKEKVTGTAP